MLSSARLKLVNIVTVPVYGLGNELMVVANGYSATHITASAELLVLAVILV